MSKKKTGEGTEYLSPWEFGELLNLNRESIYRALARGELEAVRVGRSIRLPRNQLTCRDGKGAEIWEKT